MSDVNSMIEALQVLERECGKQNGFSVRGVGANHIFLKAGDKFALVHVTGKQRAEPVLQFEIQRDISPGGLIVGCYLIPDHHSQGGRIVIPDGSLKDLQKKNGG